MIDNMFLLAVGAFGWGLSLASYRMFARKFAWPMGALHADMPAIPVLLGLAATMAGLLFAATRGVEYGGHIIVGCGFLLFMFWIGFLRVGSQISIFLAPAVTVFLLIGWFATDFGFAKPGYANKRPSDYFQSKTMSDHINFRGRYVNDDRN